MNSRPVVFCSIVLLLAGCAPPVVIVVTPTPPPTPQPTVTSIPRPTPKPTWTPYPLVASNFDVELIIIEKQCFGSAGCLITFEPDLQYHGGIKLHGQYRLVYEVDGTDGQGPPQFSVMINGDQYTPSEHTVTTGSEADELSARVVRLLER